MVADTYDVEEPVDDFQEEGEDDYYGEEDYGEYDQEELEGEEFDQDLEDSRPEDEQWFHEERPDQWRPEGPVEGGFDARFEVEPVSYITREEISAEASELTDEAREIVSSVRDKIQGNKALALSIIQELQSLQWTGAGAGAGNAGVGADWAEKYGAGDWATQYGGDWASQYMGGAEAEAEVEAEPSSFAFGDHAREGVAQIRDRVAERIN